MESGGFDDTRGLQATAEDFNKNGLPNLWAFDEIAGKLWVATIRSGL